MNLRDGNISKEGNMRVIAIRDNYEGCPDELKLPGSSIKTIVHLTIEKEYEVCSISVFDGVLSLQVVDDTEQPSWEPAWFFKMVQSSIPSDWICNIWDNSVQMVMGPTFIASDLKSYEEMIQLYPESVRKFWERHKRLYETKE